MDAAEFERFLAYRGITKPCAACMGAGARAYGDTSTWRRRTGGAVITHDVCDACWGSGDATKPWTDLRAVERSKAERYFDALCAMFSFKDHFTARDQIEIVDLLNDIASCKVAPKRAHAGTRELAACIAEALEMAVRQDDVNEASKGEAR